MDIRCGYTTSTELVGCSPQIGQVRTELRMAAGNGLPVLLLGESGTGKEVAARAIYRANPGGQFVPIDCGALVGTLMESELFGHTRGAFTGATEPRKGLMAAAEGGVAFFDEIGDLPLDMQVKLLRLVQEGEYRPVGSQHWHRANFRLVAATHHDLESDVAAGRFRLDLFYRLNVLTIVLPPLRERKEDIALLLRHFIGDANLPIVDWIPLLERHDWPGNVRELKHCVERMLALRANGVGAAELYGLLEDYTESGKAVGWGRSGKAALTGVRCVTSARAPVVPSIRETERQVIAKALRATGGQRGKAASMLEVSRATLYRKIKRYRIDYRSN